MKTTLYNRISNHELQTRAIKETTPRIIVSFYKYFFINNPITFRNNFYCFLHKLNILGRIYIASEGINAQISIPKNNFNVFREILYEKYSQLKHVHLNISLNNPNKAFWVLRIKVRPYIVADNINDSTFNLNKIGSYLKAEEVNKLLEDLNSIFVDIRNSYEYEIGHFKKAIKIPSNTFREQLLILVNMLQNKKNTKIILYCTNGIRCEKASAWLIHNNFTRVYQIKGGILGYVNRVNEKKLPLNFFGKLFVFDARLGERISQDILANCHQCKNKCDNHTNCHNKNCHKLFIQCFNCYIKYNGCCSINCKKTIIN